MTYLWVNLAVLGLVAVLAALALRGVPAARRRRTLLVAGAAFAVSAVFTAVFDSLIISAGIVAYDEAHLLGLRIGTAPVEDFAYALAAMVLLPALWVGRRHRSGKERR
ncbi:lycopene cyclase domain-containing protein [Kytococcus sp. Marseille-QA3725]